VTKPLSTETPATPLLQVENLSRQYGPIAAVNNISFSLQRGEVLGFLGPNGAGKSTTMKMITGNLAPSQGSMIIDGFDMQQQPKEAKNALGYLPEQPPVYKELTVDEYLLYCARLNRIAKSKLASALDNAKQRCGLTQVGKRLIGNLSKGYQQRVGIAQAIIHGPELVILDEPTVGLDPIQIREIRALIRELGKEHSVILSTHILPEVQSTCDRVQIIKQGALVFNDTIEGMIRRMQSSSLITQFSTPPALEALRAIPGVSGVETLPEQRFRLQFPPEHSPAEQVVQQAVTQGWGLRELTPERMSLEQVFVDLTRDEPEPQPIEQEAPQ